MFLIDPVHGSSQHQIIFIAYFLTSLKFCLQNVCFSKRGELKALRAGLKRLQWENLQPMKKKKKKKHLGPVQTPNFSWAEPIELLVHEKFGVFA